MSDGDARATGALVLAGAPLGNPGDASTRLREALATADVIAAEDTRRLHRLTRELDIEVTGRVVSYFEGNEERRTGELLADMRAGAVVAVVTDGGMPSVSDPGFRLVRAAIAAEIPVRVAPGPSAVTTAIAISGLPCDRFCFEGFPPRRSSERRRYLAGLATEVRTLVFFESPRRIAATMADLATALGHDRPAALCRELTKTYEEVRRGTLGTLLESLAEAEARGEITLVVAGAPEQSTRPTDADLRAAVAAHEQAGNSRRDAIAAVAATSGVPRREVYALIVNN